MTRALVLLLFVLLLPILPAQAASCRAIAGHEICIVDIQRSAKNYWEYRAVVKVDSVTRPVEVYNCRDRFLTRQDGTQIPFSQEPAASLVCRLYRK
ncbi:hypothetical protein H6G02_02195 [Leptolyngbya sp. FACHB-16]|nr:hypothetical protein [Leptolyngbya sp. FACHB-8]MBD2153325.1 hypothetical protein [Leptolyngbya sp. FACHB-16]